MAGCTGSDPEPETDSESDAASTGSEEEETDDSETEDEEEETDDSETEDEDEGLDLDFTWEDIEQAELEDHRNSVLFNSALDAAERSHIQNADLTDYDEFQDAILRTTNEIVDTLDDIDPDAPSSTMVRPASAAINIILHEELENNEEYEKEGLEFRMMPLINDAHGYAQVASTHHPLTTVDSNEPIVGPASEAPLDERNTRDPISRFYNKDFDDVDELERPVYIGFPFRIYSMFTYGSTERSISIENDVIDEYYDKVITREDGSLFLGAVRDAVAAITYLLYNDYMEEYHALSLATGPEDLPSRSDHEGFDEYAEEILEDHLVGYDTSEDVIENNRGLD